MLENHVKEKTGFFYKIYTCFLVKKGHVQQNICLLLRKCSGLVKCKKHGLAIKLFPADWVTRLKNFKCISTITRFVCNLNLTRISILWGKEIVSEKEGNKNTNKRKGRVKKRTRNTLPILSYFYGPTI